MLSSAATDLRHDHGPCPSSSGGCCGDGEGSILEIELKYLCQKRGTHRPVGVLNLPFDESSGWACQKVCKQSNFLPVSWLIPRQRLPAGMCQMPGHVRPVSSNVSAIVSIDISEVVSAIVSVIRFVIIVI